ncbi:MAG: AAA family ATPase [Chloroflexi bacterium]|nr:AAA family ATPase [Chloroflexota bacterium]
MGMTNKTDELERQNMLNLAYRDRSRELGKILTPSERKTIRDQIYQELDAKNTGADREPCNWRAHAITQGDLVNAKLKPLEFLVEGLLISPGLCVFGGRKKAGKSWFILDGSQRIAGGAPWLGKRVKQGKVVYLALEDGVIRLQERLHKLNSDHSLPILYITEFKPLNTEEGMSDFESMIKTESPALVVIDTLASATDRELDENRAGDMSELMKQLHSLALVYGTTILVIAHHGKRSFNDVGYDLRGSSATPSASDVNMGIYRNSDRSYDLRIEGRDLPDTELRLQFDVETMTFQLKGDSKDERRRDAELNILEAIEALGGEADAAMIATELGLTRMAVQHTCQRMRKYRLLDFRSVPTGKTRTNKILYSLPETDVSPLSTLSPLNTEKEDKDDKKEKDDNSLRDNSDKEEKEDTPISEVNSKEVAPDVLPVGMFKSLGKDKSN